MFKDYYKLLEITQNANDEEIKKAFREQAIKWHPDRNPGTDTTLRMQEINEAYLILKDKEARERYNIEYGKFSQYQENKSRTESKKAKSEFRLRQNRFRAMVFPGSWVDYSVFGSIILGGRGKPH